MIEEAAAEGLVLHRPAGGVHDQARAGLVGRDLPELLDADRVGLLIAALGEPELAQQLLAQVAAGSLGKDRVLAMKLHAKLEVVARLAILLDAHVAGRDALHAALLVVDHLGGGKAGEDLNAQAFGLLSQPLDDVGQADHIAAVVVEIARHQPVGRARAAGLAQEQDVVAADRLVQRCAHLLPVRQQLGNRARVHHGAGEDVRTGLRALSPAPRH